MPDSSYLLGTHAEQLERLRFQNQLWQPTARAAWQRAGLHTGEHVLDLGAGPGFAALDLAEVVGAEGRVLGLELSDAYVRRAEPSPLHRERLRWSCANTICSPIPGQRSASI